MGQALFYVLGFYIHKGMEGAGEEQGVSFWAVANVLELNSCDELGWY